MHNAECSPDDAFCIMDSASKTLFAKTPIGEDHGSSHNLFVTDTIINIDVTESAGASANLFLNGQREILLQIEIQKSQTYFVYFKILEPKS